MSKSPASLAFAMVHIGPELYKNDQEKAAVEYKIIEHSTWMDPIPVKNGTLWLIKTSSNDITKAMEKAAIVRFTLGGWSRTELKSTGMSCAALMGKGMLWKKDYDKLNFTPEQIAFILLMGQPSGDLKNDLSRLAKDFDPTNTLDIHYGKYINHMFYVLCQTLESVAMSFEYCKKLFGLNHEILKLLEFSDPELNSKIAAGKGMGIPEEVKIHLISSFIVTPFGVMNGKMKNVIAEVISWRWKQMDPEKVGDKALTAFKNYCGTSFSAIIKNAPIQWIYRFWKCRVIDDAIWKGKYDVFKLPTMSFDTRNLTPITCNGALIHPNPANESCMLLPGLVLARDRPYICEFANGQELMSKDVSLFEKRGIVVYDWNTAHKLLELQLYDEKVGDHPYYTNNNATFVTDEMISALSGFNCFNIMNK